MKNRDHVRGLKRGSRARRLRRQYGWVRIWNPGVMYWAPLDVGPPDLKSQFLDAWPKGWKELGTIEDQPPPPFRPAIPETDAGRRLKGFHREFRGYGLTYYVRDELSEFSRRQYP